MKRLAVDGLSRAPASRALTGRGGLRVLFDASALTKRYACETGSDRVTALFGEAGELLVAAHCQTEVASALLRLRRGGSLPVGEFDRAWSAAQRDVADMVCIPLDRQVERFAFVAMEHGSLPTMDALHVASALAADVDLFVTADHRQAKAARGLGLQTECVGAEPVISQEKY